jgi:hypothetical protein
MRWVGHVGCLSEIRNVQNILVGCSKGETIREVNMKINLKDIGCRLD